MADETPTVTPEAQASPGTQQTWEWLQRLAEDAHKGRRDQARDEEWDDTRLHYWGTQWDTSLPNFKLPIVVNELKTYILNEVSDLTDNPIKVFVHKDRTKGERDEKVEQAIQALWIRKGIDLQVMQAALDSMIYPAGFLGCFARKLANGEVDLDIRAIDPTCIYPDPDATSDDDWRYVLIEEIVDLVQLRDEFPERGAAVTPDDAHSIKSPNASPWWQLWRRWGSGAYKGPLNAPTAGTRATGYAKARVAKLTLFIYDDEVEEDIKIKKDEQGNEVLDEQGNQILVSITKKKYPNGRMIIGANREILFDGPYPYTGPFPIVRVIAEPTTHEFWLETSPVEGVKVLSQAGNKMDSMVVENGIRLNNGIVIADADSGLKPGTFAGLPGSILLKRTGTSVEIKYPNAMPADMVNMGQRFRDFMAKVLGFSQSRVGSGNRGNVSGELTETEISQSMGLTRLRARLLHASVQKLVEMIFHRMAQYYTVPRMIPYIHASQWSPVPWQPINKPEDYGVHVDPASFTLRSKTLLQRLTLALSKMGKVSTEYTLKTLEMPDGDAEAKKAMQELQLKAAANELQKRQKRK